MLIVGIIIGVVGVLIIATSYYVSERGQRPFISIALMGVLYIMVGLLIFIGKITEKTPEKKSLKEYSLKTEININTTNGVEISRDTVYIFTPKKK